jgi:hypothetical protein
MIDYKIRAIAQKTLVNAGTILSLPTCSLEARMRIAIGVEAAMSAIALLADDADLTCSIEDVRRAAYSAGVTYGRLYAAALVSA